MRLRVTDWRIADCSIALLAVILLAACDNPESVPEPSPSAAPATVSANSSGRDLPDIGLMTSLPLYWPLDADVTAIASGSIAKPWQRLAIEQAFDIVPLDTLSPIPGLTADDPETDPLAGLARLAVVQPRGLSPADNVALDKWVEAGGQLLLVLDPLLTGDYEFALGDPRRPVDTALIPPVVERWGLAVSFDADQDPAATRVSYAGGAVLRSMAGKIDLARRDDKTCQLSADRIIARCKIGKGTVTLVADAASFELALPAGPSGTGAVPAPITALLDFAFSR